MHTYLSVCFLLGRTRQTVFSKNRRQSGGFKSKFYGAKDPIFFLDLQVCSSKCESKLHKLWQQRTASTQHTQLFHYVYLGQRPPTSFTNMASYLQQRKGEGEINTLFVCSQCLSAVSFQSTIDHHTVANVDLYLHDHLNYLIIESVSR